ncbi:MAG: hypothetical protein IJ939_06330, partial [Clostridia bacterium]|nr:hypothetical protein [Clostridia bacterium]
MSTRVFQSVINQLKDTVDRTIAVIDDTGVIIACSELVRIGEKQTGVLDLFSSDDEVVTAGGNTYRLIGSIAKVDNIIMVQGEDRESADVCAVLAVSFMNIKNLYGENYDHILYNPTVFEWVKNDLDANIAEYNKVISSIRNTDIYLYYIEKETDINFVTGEKSQIYEYLCNNIKLPASRT